MEVYVDRRLPSVRKDLGSPRGSRNVIEQVPDKQLSRIEVAGPLVQRKVEAVEGNLTAVLGHLVDGMRPGVAELPGKAMPGVHPHRHLHRVVLRGAVAVELQRG